MPISDKANIAIENDDAYSADFLTILQMRICMIWELLTMRVSLTIIILTRVSH
jgi:hypothetical protein